LWIADASFAMDGSWKSGALALLCDHSMSSKNKRVASVGFQAPSSDDEGSESSASSFEDDSTDSSSSSDDAGEESIGMKVARQRVVKSTRSRYERCIRSMGRWMKDNGLVPSLRLAPPLNQHAVEVFFDHLDKKRVKWHNHPNPSQVKRLSLGAVRAVGSAIFHLYRIHSLAVCDRLKIFFNNFHRYHILNIAQDKAHVPPLFPSSGNSEAISVEAYQLLCLRAWQYTPESLTGQGTGRNWANCRSLPLFFTQAKPLMSRRERLVRTQFQFLKKHEDHICYKTPTTKSDQEGTLSYWKAVFGMPHVPQCCPFLSLGIEVMSRSVHDSEESFRMIFPKSFADNSHAFIRAFVNSFSECDRCVMNLGHCSVLPITSHTPKRSACFQLHACEGVNWNSAMQRGDHDIGTEGHYLSQPADGQDQIMGRVLADLPFGWAGWQMLPPYFPEDVDIEVRDLIPAFDKFPVETRSIFRFLIASVVYHTQWLETNVPSVNPIFSIPLLSSRRDVNVRLRERLQGGKFGGSMKATGYSIMGGTHQKVDEILKILQHSAPTVAACGTGAVVSLTQPAPVVASAAQSTAVVAPNHVMRLLSDIHCVVHGKPSSIGPIPIAEVPSTFKLPTGYRPEQLWRQWFGGHPRPWRFLVNKNLTSKQERDLLKKYGDVMEAIRCRVPIAWIEADFDGAFRACWTKFCQVAHFSITCQWSCAYMYDKVTKDIEDRLRATSVLSAQEFVLAKANVKLRAALHSVDLAQGLVREAAMASLPPAISQAARAQLAADTVASVVAQASGRDELQCVQCWVCANFTPPANLRSHFIYHHAEDLSALRELERRMPSAFPGVLTLWQDCSERVLCNRKGLSWMSVDGRIDSGHAGQLWRRAQNRTYLFRGAVSQIQTKFAITASGAGMLSVLDGTETEAVTFGKFVGEGILDVSHLHIEMHKTHARWGVGQSMQECDAFDIE
jgi:hypothetical protein